MPDGFRNKTKGCDYLGGEWIPEISRTPDAGFASSDFNRWQFHSAGYCRVYVARRFEYLCRARHLTQSRGAGGLFAIERIGVGLDGSVKAAARFIKRAAAMAE